MSSRDFAMAGDRQGSKDRSPARRLVRAVARAFAALLGIVLAGAAVLLATALYALRAAPGDDIAID